MARNTRSSALESRSARLKLPKRGKPIGSASIADLRLGYRRIEIAGPWIVRRATGKGGNWIKNFATADDFEESNGDSVLTFFEAQAIARTIARDGEASGGLITVSAAIDRYAGDLATRGGREYNAASPACICLRRYSASRSACSPSAISVIGAMGCSRAARQGPSIAPSACYELRWSSPPPPIPASPIPPPLRSD